MYSKDGITIYLLLYCCTGVQWILLIAILRFMYNWLTADRDILNYMYILY